MAGRGPKISLALKLVKGFFSPFGIFGHEEGQICTIYLLGDIQSPVSATSAAASMLIYSSLVTEHLRSQARPSCMFGGVHKLTGSLYPLSFLQLVRLVIVRQRNGVPVLVT